MCVPRAVMLDRPKNALLLLAPLAVFTLGYLLLIIVIKPFRDHDGRSGWTAGDKAQANAQVAALLQYAMAGLSLSYGGSIDDVPAAVEGTVTLVSLVSIVGPIIYQVLLAMGVDICAPVFWCLGGVGENR
eukprot:COSAG06_NODE_8587_length_2122_cov_14.561048_2_plen_130_part_00